MAWVIMIGGLLMAAVVAVFIDAWDRRARRKREASLATSTTTENTETTK
jgi:hypothetical protein